MKQLRPRTILAFGLPGSLLVNTGVAALVFSLLSEGQTGWWIPATALAASAWLLLSVPTLIGMAVIRSQIGQSNERQQTIRAASRCCSVCIAITVLGLGGGYLVRAQMIFELPIVASISIFAGTIAATLAVLTVSNILLRSFTNDWGTKPT